MKIKDNDVLYKLRNQRLLAYNLWYSSFNKGNLSEFRNYDSLRISVEILQRHLN